LDLRGAIPTFIHISDGKLGDVNVLDLLTFGAGAFYVIDRGDVDFARIFALHQTGGCLVTRARSPIDARLVCLAPVDRAIGVIWDQRLMLNG
jgi:DNA mismatch repair protein MutH